jgi:hypothetical protein
MPQFLYFAHDVAVHVLDVIYFGLLVWLNDGVGLEVPSYGRIGLIRLVVVQEVVVRGLTFVLFLLKSAVLVHVILLTLDAVVCVCELHVYVLGDEALRSRCLSLIDSICAGVWVRQLAGVEMAHLLCLFGL